MDELNPFAARFAERLFAEYPEWRANATVDGKDAPLPGALAVRVPNPRPGGPPLEIETDDEEVTVFFDSWHGHYGRWGDGEFNDPFRNVLRAIAGILDESLVVADDYEGEKWVGGQLAEPGALKPPAPGIRRFLRSWLGTHDSDSAVPAA